MSDREFVIHYVPEWGPNGGHFSPGYRVFPSEPQAPGGFFPPATERPGYPVAQVDGSGELTVTDPRVVGHHGFDRAVETARSTQKGRPHRYDQCDSTCTVDCGHCKGNGPPIEAVQAGVDPRAVAAVLPERTEWNTVEMQEEFDCSDIRFSYGSCGNLRRKLTGEVGSLLFERRGNERIYYGWQVKV